MRLRSHRLLGTALVACVPALGMLLAFGPAAGASTAASSPSARAAAAARIAIEHLQVGQHGAVHRMAGDASKVKGLTQVVSSNWSGYADTGSSFSKVTASWTEPTGVASSRRTTSLAAFWVGIDGYSSDTVEQDGTLIESYEGTLYYYDWWEIYPENDVQTVASVSPGDHITSTVTRSGDSYTLSVTDSTHPADSFSTTQTYSGAADSSAEWIAEAPSGSSGVYPLTQFSTFSLSGASVTEGSTSGTISSFTDDEITMEDSSGHVEAQPGSLTSGGAAFTVTWERST
jgi:hypothetical protein